MSCFFIAFMAQATMLISSASGISTGNATDEDHLIWSLLASYNMHARPTVEAVNVTLSFNLESIDKLEEREQVLRVAAYIDARWTDRRLVWDPKQWDGLNFITLPANMIWKPDFALINSANDIYNKAFYSSYYLVEVSYEGAISWTPFGPMAVRCVPNLAYYPFDTQFCHFRFENWVYRSTMCRLLPESNSINLDKFIGSGEWSITNTSAEEVEVFYDGYSNYSDLFFYITLKRKTWFFTLHIVFPCALMSVLVCFVFILPAESEEKVALNITLLLSFVVFLINVSEEMPRTSDYTPLLSGYITLITCTSALSLICTIYVIRISHHGRREVPRWLQSVLVEKLGRLLCVVPRKNKPDEVQLISLRQSIRESSPSKPDDKSASSKEDPRLRDILNILKEIELASATKRQMEERRHDWNVVGIVIDRVFFCIFALVTLIASLVILVIIPTDESHVGHHTYQ